MSGANHLNLSFLNPHLPSLATLLLLQVSLSALTVTVATLALLKAISGGSVGYTYTEQGVR